MVDLIKTFGSLWDWNNLGPTLTILLLLLMNHLGPQQWIPFYEAITADIH